MALNADLNWEPKRGRATMQIVDPAKIGAKDWRGCNSAAVRDKGASHRYYGVEDGISSRDDLTPKAKMQMSLLITRL